MALRRPLERAVAGALFLFALSAPWSIALAQIGVVALALLVVARRLSGGARPSPWPLAFAFIAAYLVIQALSIPLGVHPGRSLACFRGSWVLLFPFVFWAVLDDPTLRRRGLCVLVGSAALAGIYGGVQHVQGVDWLHGGETLERYESGGYLAVGNLSSHLTYAGVLLPVFFLAVGLALDRASRARALAGVAALAIGTGILFSFTRTAWIGAGAGIVFLALGLGVRRGLLALASLAVIVLVAALSERAIAERLLSIVDLDDPRWRLWRTALRIVADHPITGAGLGAFPTLFPAYKVPGSYLSTIHPHHDLLNAAVETGVIGAVAWLSIWIAFFREGANAAPSWMRRGFGAGVLALLVAGLGQCYSTDEEVAQVWFFVLAAALHEARTGGPRARPLVRRIEKRFKARALPIARRLLARPGRNGGAQAGPERILVVRPDGRLGNLLLMTPFLIRLRAARPRAVIGMVADRVNSELFAAWPWVDTWFLQDKRAHIRAPWRFVGWLRAIRRGGWDVAFEMSNHNTHSFYSCLLTLASGAPVRVGFDEPRNQDTLTRAVAPPAPTVAFSLAPLALLEAMGWPARPAALACPLGRAAERTEPDARAVVVHVGGRGGKALEPDVWSRIVRRLAAAVSNPIVLVAGPEDTDRMPPIDAGLSARIRIAPPMGLRELARLLMAARAYVGCDSGVLHLAVAVDTPAIGVFFRSNPYHYAPLGSAHATVLLANPYGVDPTTWGRPFDGLARSRLFVAETNAVSSRAGDPATDARALDLIAAALLAAPTTEDEACASKRSGSTGGSSAS